MSEEGSEKIEPETVLKGVLNTLMSSKQAATPLTPGRRAAPTSAFSTPSRSFSSVQEEDELQEVIHIDIVPPRDAMMAEIRGDQKPGQIKLEMDDDEKESTPTRGGARMSEESPRSALDEIPYHPGTESPTAEESSEGSPSFKATTMTPAQSMETSLRLAALISPSRNLPPRPPPSSENDTTRNDTSHDSSVQQNNAKISQDSTTVDEEVPESPDRTELRQPDCLVAPVDLSNISFLPVNRSGQGSASEQRDNDTTLLATNLGLPETTTKTGESSPGRSEVGSPVPSIVQNPVSTPPGATWSSPLAEKEVSNASESDDASSSPHPQETESASTKSENLDPDSASQNQKSYGVPSPLPTPARSAKSPDKSSPSYSSHSTPGRSYESDSRSSQSQFSSEDSPHSKQLDSSTDTTPDRLPNLNLQPSPTGSSQSSSKLSDRLSRAKESIRKFRGLVSDTDMGIPPKPPTIAPVSTTPVPPPPQMAAGASPCSDRTPVVSNQNRKTYGAPEEKKEADDWPSSAVRQMNKAVNKLRSLGETFIHDEKGRRRNSSTSIDGAGDAESGVSESSGQWWQKEEIFNPQRAKTTAKPVESTNVVSTSLNRTTSPSPPPLILRTAHDPNLVKPVPMELTRTADLILQPTFDDHVLKDEEDMLPTSSKNATGPAAWSSTADPSSSAETSPDRAVTPMMRMRVPGAQESVLMEENEAVPSSAEGTPSSQKSATAKEQSVEASEDNKTQMTPEPSRRKSSKGRSRSGSTRRSRRSRNSRRSGSRQRSGRRQKGGIFTNAAAQCGGGFPNLLTSLLDQQCGPFLGDNDDDGSESTYSSVESDDSDTYGDSLKSSPAHSSARLNQSETQESIEIQDLSVDNQRDKEKEVTMERERVGVKTGPEAPAPRRPVMDEERSVERVRRRQNEASNLRNKSFIREFIAELASDGMKLLQHRRSHRQAFTRATEVTAYLRMGTEDSTNSFSEPCLQFLAHDGIPVISIDLFDVRSLEKASALQLQLYPYAVPGNSLLIRTNQGDFVFEAKKEEDAVRMVHGMRWLIARLSFNLIIGNVNVSCELLDVGRKAFKQRVGEFNRAKAMNDLANHLVDKSSLFSAV